MVQLVSEVAQAGDVIQIPDLEEVEEFPKVGIFFCCMQKFRLFLPPYTCMYSQSTYTVPHMLGLDNVKIYSVVICYTGCTCLLGSFIIITLSYYFLIFSCRQVEKKSQTTVCGTCQILKSGISQLKGKVIKLKNKIASNQEQWVKTFQEIQERE